METKVTEISEMTLHERALIAARRERQATEEKFSEVQRIYIDAKKRMQDAQTRFDALSNRRVNYEFDMRDAMLPASLHVQPGWHRAEIISAEQSRFGGDYMTVKFRFTSGHHLTLNYIICGSDNPEREVEHRAMFLELVDAALFTCKEDFTLQDLLPAIVGRYVMLECRGNVGGGAIPAITYDGNFWPNPRTESCSPATGQAAA